MRYAIVKTYWRDNRNPFPGRLTEVKKVKVRGQGQQRMAEQITAGSARDTPRTELEIRRFRNFMRKLTPRQRRFVSVLRHVVETVPGPENLQRKKIMERLKIKDRNYFYLLKSLQ